MKKLFALLFLSVLLFGCVNQGPSATTSPSPSITVSASAQPSLQAGVSAQKGDVVYVDYTAKTLDGLVFDTTLQEEAKKANLPVKVFAPARYTLGKGEVLPAVEEQIYGMKVGETKAVTVPPEKSFGVYNPARILRIPANEFAQPPEPRQAVKVNNTAGIIIDVFMNYTLVDFNPLLAGHTLVFDVTLRNVTKG